MIFPIFIVIFFLFANLLVPLFLYHQKHGLFERRYKGKGGCNGWSFVMDGIAASLINFVVAKYLLEMKIPIQNYNVMLALVIGFLIMISAHIWMSVCKWEVWIMPKPWKWNAGGYWHMISMTLQMAFLTYPFVLLMQEEISIVIKKYLWFGVFGVLLFLWSFKRSERDLKIGRFILRSRAW